MQFTAVKCTLSNSIYSLFPMAFETFKKIFSPFITGILHQLRQTDEPL